MIVLSLTQEGKDDGMSGKVEWCGSERKCSKVLESGSAKLGGCWCKEEKMDEGDGEKGKMDEIRGGRYRKVSESARGKHSIARGRE